MSYTILFIVPESGPIQAYREFQNSHLWARPCWEYLAMKYLRMDAVEVLMHSDRVWPLFKEGRLPEYERIALGSTYDWVMVRREELPRLHDAFTQFADALQVKSTPALAPGMAIFLPDFTGGDDNPRWHEMATAINDLIQSEEQFVAICWCVTSITDAWWVPDGDDSRLYDLSRDDRHWFLFDRMAE